MTPETESKIRRLIVDTMPEPMADGSIFGPTGVLDSMGLVSFLADLEHRVGEEFGRNIVLASEKAMSRGGSPFRDVTVLTAYVGELLET